MHRGMDGWAGGGVWTGDADGGACGRWTGMGGRMDGGRGWGDGWTGRGGARLGEGRGRAAAGPGPALIPCRTCRKVLLRSSAHVILPDQDRLTV